MWDPSSPDHRSNPHRPAVEGGVFTAGPPEKSPPFYLALWFLSAMFCSFHFSKSCTFWLNWFLSILFFLIVLMQLIIFLLVTASVYNYNWFFFFWHLTKIYFSPSSLQKSNRRKHSKQFLLNWFPRDDTVTCQAVTG